MIMTTTAPGVHFKSIEIFHRHYHGKKIRKFLMKMGTDFFFFLKIYRIITVHRNKIIYSWSNSVLYCEIPQACTSL
jgi:uncharacterized protein YecE (DUF72 family)